MSSSYVKLLLGTLFSLIIPIPLVCFIYKIRKSFSNGSIGIWISNFCMGNVFIGMVIAIISQTIYFFPVSGELAKSNISQFQNLNEGVFFMRESSESISHSLSVPV